MVKPKYYIPTVKEIEKIKPNGFNVVSTFSGGGGSCTGYRMAGYNVLYANEFIDSARETYKANNPNSYLDNRDIRDVSADSILSKLGFSVGEIDLFDGSPPCASFSMSGARDKGWGKEKKYSDKSQRTDDLFYEYSRLIGGLQPKVFVAENVAGLVSGKAKGYFINIIRALKANGYNVKAALLDAQYLGVPQTRKRVIFVGVRNDLEMSPVFPRPFSYKYILRDILTQPYTAADKETDISKYAIGANWDKLKQGESDTKYFNLIKPSLDKPCPAILASAGNLSAASVTHPTVKRKFTIDELKLICSFPPDYYLSGDYARQVERMGRSVPPLMMKAISETVAKEILSKI